jgi:phosphatidylethanolamine-binding protein (PEBP) family uncharacterized protein
MRGAPALRPRMTFTTAVFAALVMTLALSGCGGSRSASTATSASTVASTSATSIASKTATASEKVPNVDLPMRSPVNLRPISARYTCDGADISLPVEWGNVPANTAEIDLFIVSLTHLQESTEWAVAGLKPGVHGISAGKLPPGAVVGRNSFGQTRYSICPQKGSTIPYIVLLFPLPRRIPVKSGFRGEALSRKAVETAEFEGQLGFVYKRA